jgi:hypothetical protein
MIRLAALFGFSLFGAVLAGPVVLTESSEGLAIVVEGKAFSTYRITGSQRPFMYPVMGPGGAALTRELPWTKSDDHPHHSSIWIGHGKVNDTDFWLNGDDNGKIEHTGFSNITSDDKGAAFTACARWVMPDGDVLMTDERRISLSVLPQGGRVMDWHITFKAGEEDVTFQDTKEGTMAIRVAPILSIREGEGKILTSAGIKNKKAWGTKAEWVCFYGKDPKGEQVTITMMDHPSNLRHPTTWHARDYGLFAANPFGLHDFEKSDDETKGNYVLKAGETLTQRYRIIIQSGEPDAEKLKGLFAEFGNGGK